jgi:hypothetical protein
MDDTKVKDAARHDEEEEDCDVESGNQQHEDTQVSTVVDEDQPTKSLSTEETIGATELMHEQNTASCEKHQEQRSETTVTSPGAVAASSHGGTETLANRKAATQPYSVYAGEVETKEEEDDILLDATSHAAPAHNHPKEEEETETFVVMLEATPVQEIYATQVVLEEIIPARQLHPQPHNPQSQSTSPFPPHPSGLTVQHVDIDNFNMDDPDRFGPMEITDKATASSTSGSADDSSSLKRVFPPLSHILLLVLGITLGFAAVVLGIFMFLMPEEDEIGTLPQDDKCLYQQVLLLFHLEQLRGKAWIEMPIASTVLGVLGYYTFDLVQDKYCLAPDAPPPSPSRSAKRDFYVNLIVFSLEIFWLFVVMALIIGIRMEELRDPAQQLEKACAPRSGELDDIGNHIRDLNTYYNSAIVRLSFLIFLLVARGRILFSPQSCEHVAPFWRRFWTGLKMTLELTLLLVAATRMTMCLLPVIADLKNFEYERQQELNGQY